MARQVGGGSGNGGGSGGGGGPGGDGGGGSGGGGGKGDLYGDLYVIERVLTDNGAPKLDDNSNVILIGSDGNPIYLTPDGEIPEESLGLVQEVEFSRLSVIRSPDRVIDKALDAVLSRLAVDDEGNPLTDVTTDPAGRLMLDGETVDAPLENLALYEYIMKNPGNNVLSKFADVDPDEDVDQHYDNLDTAASLFGAAADKTTPIIADTVVYSNAILGLNPVNGYYNFDGYDYSRLAKYGGDDNKITWYQGDADNNGQPDSHTGTVLQAVFGGTDWTDDIPDPYGFDDFVQAADDTRAVIDFMHTYMAEPYVPPPEPVAMTATLADFGPGSGPGYGMAYGVDGDCPLADGSCLLLA